MTLPKPQSDLAAENIKDPYHFDFLGLEEDAQEREIEHALTQKITDFMLELGKGFAFVGRQYGLEYVAIKILNCSFVIRRVYDFGEYGSDSLNIVYWHGNLVSLWNFQVCSK